MNRAPIVIQIAADVETIVSGLAAALRHLEDWTGEMPSSGASAGTPDDDDEVPAVTGDAALRIQLAVLGRIRLAAVAAIDAFADVDGVRLPVEVVHEAHSLAVLRWATRRLGRDAASVPDRKLDSLSRLVAHARSLVVEYQPTATTAPQGCRLHRAAGDHAEIDERFRSAGLCRRCGEFRRMHERSDPTPAILRAWSKGIKPTAAQITEAKIVAKKKRKRKRAA